MSRARPYVTPTHYTQADLLRLRAADLYTDLRCATRDGLTAYAVEVQAEIDTLAAAHPVETAQGAQLAAKWAGVGRGGPGWERPQLLGRPGGSRDQTRKGAGEDHEQVPH